MSPSLKSRFSGALLGCPVGDALGAPFEGLSEDDLVRVDDLTSGFQKIRGYPLGQYTDDTQLTLALAETYIEHSRFDGEGFGRRVARLWSTREIVGAGGACTHAAYNLIQGIPWTEAGAPVGQAGNGTAMRASPVGLFRWRDRELLFEESLDQSRVTHQDPRAGAGATAVAFAVAWNLAEREPEPGKFSDELAELLAPVHQEFASYVRRLPEWLDKEPKEAVPEMACAGWLEPPRPIKVITPFVVPTVLASLWAFFKHPDDFCAGVERVIRLGGDVDTTGAITGAIIGSRVGEEGVPEGLRSLVLEGARIKKTALDLYQRSA